MKILFIFMIFHLIIVIQMNRQLMVRVVERSERRTMQCSVLSWCDCGWRISIESFFTLKIVLVSVIRALFHSQASTISFNGARKQREVGLRRVGAAEHGWKAVNACWRLANYFYGRQRLELLNESPHGREAVVADKGKFSGE